MKSATSQSHNRARRSPGVANIIGIATRPTADAYETGFYGRGRDQRSKRARTGPVAQCYWRVLQQPTTKSLAQWRAVVLA
jgi:hypothetical protein